MYRCVDGTLAGTPWRADRLGEELATFAESLGLPPPQVPHAKQGMLSDTLDPAEWLTREKIEEINEVFAEEFEVFGYPRLT